MTTRTLMLLANGFEPDPRVHKEARSLVAAGFHPHIICLDRRCDLPATQELDGIILHRIRVGKVRAGDPRSLMVALPRFYLKALRLARRLHGKEPFGLVHCHDLDTMAAGVAIKKLLLIPLVYDMHDLYSSFFGDPRLERAVLALDARMRRVADRMIVVNDRFLDLPGVDRVRTTVVMNCPDSDAAGARSEDDTGLFYAGNMEAQRDMRYALATLCASGLPVVFAGDGPLLASYRQGVPDGSIQFLGRISPGEVFHYTARCRAVLALYDTSIRNNRLASPNKLFDAMKYGKPAIVSDESVMADIVRRHDCGLPVAYGDAAALAAAIRELADPERYRVMSRNALAAFQAHYNWGVMAPRLAALYTSLTE